MLTENGEEWFKRSCLDAKYIPEGAQNSEVAAFWLNALYREVIKDSSISTKKVIDQIIKHLLGKYNETKTF